MQWFLVFNGPNLSGVEAKKKLDVWSWSLKFEFQLQSHANKVNNNELQLNSQERPNWYKPFYEEHVKSV